MQKIENPGGGAGASENVHADGLNSQNSTPAVQKTQALSAIQQRILTLAPGVDPTTLEVRGKLMTARDYATTRIADYRAWPDRALQLHSIAVLWAGRGALSPWAEQDLLATVDMVRHLIQAANTLRDLEARHGEI